MIDARQFALKTVLRAARYSGLSALGARFFAGAGAILMLHRVSRSHISPTGMNSGLCITPEFLDVLLNDLKKQRYDIVSLDEMAERMQGRHRGRFVAITADDGYLDNLTDALPIFETHNAPFAVYVAPELTSGEVAPWWEIVDELVHERDAIELQSCSGHLTIACPDAASKRRAAQEFARHLTREVPEQGQQDLLAQLVDLKRGPRRFMNWEEIRWLSAHPLATIGAHTVHHYNLARLEKDDARWEMLESAAMIERETGRRPRHFAYPYGNPLAAGRRELELARDAGFVSAVTTRHGVLQTGHAHHMHALPRISINGNFQRIGYVRTLLSGVTTPLSNNGRRLVTV